MPMCGPAGGGQLHSRRCLLVSGLARQCWVLGWAVDVAGAWMELVV